MSDKSTPPSTTSSTVLDEALNALNSKQYEQCLNLLKPYWLTYVHDYDCIKLMARLTKEAGADELSNHLLKLADAEESKKIEPQILFEVGFRLIDMRLHELAVMLLERCLKLIPNEPVINYELGFALMSLKRYSSAIPYFEIALDQLDDFDTLLNLAVCFACTRNIDRAEQMLSRISKLTLTPEQQQELAHQQIVMRRLDRLENKFDLTARDWLYAQYGSLLLAQSDDPHSSGKFGALWNDYARIASVLLILRGVLEGIGVSFDIVEFYSPLSKPLAESLGELMGLAVEGYKGPSREERSLLVMAWASDIIGPHESFRLREPTRNIFAYGLSSTESLPVTPEIVGCLAESCAMPWDEHWKVEEFNDGRPANIQRIAADPAPSHEIAARIMERANDLESDPEIIRTIQESVSYYNKRQDLLVLNNCKTFPRRPEYSAEVPL